MVAKDGQRTMEMESIIWVEGNRESKIISGAFGIVLPR
jgi:hypothetical protein